MIESAQALKRRWQPTKERLKQVKPVHPLLLRMHRALSWMEGADRQAAAREIDAALLFRWMAFNALYGQWNDVLREPEADEYSWKQFLKHLMAKDQAGYVAACLLAEQPRVYRVFENKFLNQYFWRTLSSDRTFSVTRNRFRAERFYQEGKLQSLLEELFACMYLVRCQIVHGAATYGSKLNRQAVRLCHELLRGLLTSIARVIIDHGLQMSWDRVCYPPVETEERNAVNSPKRPR